MNQVPLISLANGDATAVAQSLGESFQTFGFAMVQNHGLDTQLIEQGWKTTKEFFAQPDQDKLRYHDPAGAGARGYTPFGTEIAKDAKAHDLKEFWHIGRELPPGHHYADIMPRNIWPETPPNFRDTGQALFAEFDRVGLALLSHIAAYLGLDRDWFDGPVKDGNSVLRLLHYPPISKDPKGLRAGAHEDINLITLLLGAEEAGLEILGKDGKWIGINPPEGALVINIGDMLQRLTNHRLPSTTHRVRNPSGARSQFSRYSMPFFLHLRPDFLIETLPSCIDEEQSNQYQQPILAHDYLMQRLREIGLV